ncbi:tetratricopeptide repeat protein [Pistricoccus aurantiacus]|uniref:tetratricopeptide repeat protein n=1 Tax=Pistricoccus aurantiacus TaxID=1883414 RepID=UPI0036385956
MTSLSERLLSPWILYSLAIGLVLALLAVFPAQRLLNMDDPERSGDQNAALLYAQASLRSEPHRLDYRLRLAKLQLEVGEIDAAGETLEPVANDPSLDAQWWLLEYQWRRYIEAFGSNELEDIKNELITRMDRYIAAVRKTASESRITPNSKRIETLALHWLALNRPDRAAKSYEILARYDVQNRFRWYSEAGRYWLQAGDPGQAAEAWHQAWHSSESVMQAVKPSDPAQAGYRFKRSEKPLAAGWLDWLVPSAQAQETQQDRERPNDRQKTGDSRREAARQSLLAAQQSGDAAQALEYVKEYLEAYPNDPELLDIAVKIYLAENQPAQALDVSRRLVKMTPEDSQLLSRHAAIAIAADKPAVAIDTLKTLRRMEPDNLGHLENLYHAYRWSGKPEQALDVLIDWAKRGENPDREREIVKLSRDLYDRQTALEALQRLQEQDAMTLEDRGQLVDLLDQLGKPDEAIAQLRQWRQAGFDDWNLSARLATLLEQVGELDEAAEVWAALAKQQKGEDPSAAREQSRLLVRLWNLKDAQEVLVEAGEPTDPSGSRPEWQHRPYWQQRSDLAYLLGNSEDTIRSLQELGEHYMLNANQRDTLMQAAYEQKDIGLVARLAKRRWQKSRDISGIIQGFQLAQGMRRPDVARELLALAEEEPEKFKDSADYWAAIGEQNLTKNSPKKALDAYRRGRKIAPDRLDLVAGEVYALAAGGQEEALKAKLEKWQSRGDESLSLAVALADGYQALGRLDRSLGWHRRIESQYPPNPQRLLNFSYLLHQTGKDRESYAARRLAMARWTPILAKQLDQPLEEADLRDQVVALTSTRTHLGGDRAASWHDALITQMDPMDDSGARQGELALQALEVLGQQERYRYLWSHRQQAGLETAPNHEVSIALQRNDNVRLRQLLNDPNVPMGKETRFYINQHLKRYDTALKQANDLHDGGGDFRAEIVNLRQQIPNRVGAQLRYRELGDLDISEESLSLERSVANWTGNLEIAKRQLDADSLESVQDASGLEDEWFGEVTLLRRGQRTQTELAIGAIESDDDTHLTAGIKQSLDFTSRLKGSLFADMGEPSEAGDLLRLLAVEDQVGASLNWTLTARDQLFLNARKLWYREREDRQRLGDGARYEAMLSHLLIEGPTRSVELQIFASHDRQDADDKLPETIAARLSPDSTPGTLLSDDSTFLGGGISFSRGLPGGAFPNVASPRLQLTLGGGQRWPSNDFAGNVSFDIGSRLFGGDELSFGIDIDDGTGVDDTTRFGAQLNYQIFLGR